MLAPSAGRARPAAPAARALPASSAPRSSARTSAARGCTADAADRRRGWTRTCPAGRALPPSTPASACFRWPAQYRANPRWSRTNELRGCAAASPPSSSSVPSGHEASADPTWASTDRYRAKILRGVGRVAVRVQRSCLAERDRLGVGAHAEVELERRPSLERRGGRDRGRSRRRRPPPRRPRRSPRRLRSRRPRRRASACSRLDDTPPGRRLLDGERPVHVRALCGSHQYVYLPLLQRHVGPGLGAEERDGRASCRRPGPSGGSCGSSSGPR